MDLTAPVATLPPRTQCPPAASREIEKSAQARSLGLKAEDLPHVLSNVEYIVALACRFPCLEAAKHLLEWDPDEFMQLHNRCSQATWQAARFIVGVWNPSIKKMDENAFNAIWAARIWDAETRAAYATWAANPYFP